MKKKQKDSTSEKEGHGMTGLSHPSYYDKTKRTNIKALDIRKIMTQYGRFLTSTTAHDTIGLSHPSYYNKTKRTNKKGTMTI